VRYDIYIYIYIYVINRQRVNWNQHLQKKLVKRKPPLRLSDAYVVKNGVLDLVWFTGSILGLSDNPYFMVPWFSGPGHARNH
jgi:hypothetical protein